MRTSASAKNGFDLVVKIADGPHRVEIGSVSHPIVFAEPGAYEVEFAYSRAWSKYSPPPIVEHIGRTQGKDWPTQMEATEPIDLDIRAGSGSPQDDAVLAELEQLQNRKTGWGAALILVVVSLLLFTAATVSMELPPLTRTVLVIATFALGRPFSPVRSPNSFCGVYTVSVRLAQSSTSALVDNQ